MAVPSAPGAACDDPRASEQRVLRRWFRVALALAIAARLGFALGTRWDVEVSVALFDPGSTLAELPTIVGQIPVLLVVLGAATAFVRWAGPRGKAVRIPVTVLSWFLALVAAATMMLALAPICFPALRRASVWLLALGVAWPIAVGWARITIGAHHLSDVTAGALVSIFFMVLFAHLWVRPGRISEANKPIRQ